MGFWKTVGKAQDTLVGKYQATKEKIESAKEVVGLDNASRMERSKLRELRRTERQDIELEKAQKEYEFQTRQKKIGKIKQQTRQMGGSGSSFRGKLADIGEKAARAHQGNNFDIMSGGFGMPQQQFKTAKKPINIKPKKKKKKQKYNKVKQRQQPQQMPQPPGFF